MNQLPLLDTIQFQRAFSLGANVTLLAANIRKDHLIMTGSGIYTPSSATYHHAQQGDLEEGKLLVARVPVLDPQWLGQSVTIEQEVAVDEVTSAAAAAESGFCHKETCDNAPPPETITSAPPTFISSMMYDPFTFTLLEKADGDLKVCNGTFCCRLQYRKLSPAGSAELYALGAFHGTHTVNGRYALQVRARGIMGCLKGPIF